MPEKSKAQLILSLNEDNQGIEIDTSVYVIGWRRDQISDRDNSRDWYQALTSSSFPFFTLHFFYSRLHFSIIFFPFIFRYGPDIFLRSFLHCALWQSARRWIKNRVIWSLERRRGKKVCVSLKSFSNANVPFFSLHPVGDAKKSLTCLFLRTSVLRSQDQKRSFDRVYRAFFTLCHGHLHYNCALLAIFFTRYVLVIVFAGQKACKSHHMHSYLRKWNAKVIRSQDEDGGDLISDVETNLIQLSIDHRPHFCYLLWSQSKQITRTH